MRYFTTLEIREAQDYADAGGQALHTHQIIVNRRKSPKCFLDAVERGEDIAHLFDRDAARLRRTATELGVRIVLIEREGERGQHVDLCGKPLRKALESCDKPSQGELF